MIVLLGLELIMLSLIIRLSLRVILELSFYFVFVLITVVVCMGGYGVSLLISFSRSSGEDFYGMNFLS
jgi:hypothetical protein